MAQTVAIQRGTAGSTSGNTAVTLFTQSSATATRVICNQLIFGYLNASMSYPRAVLIHSSSGGYQTIIGFLYANNNVSWLQFAPNANSGSMNTNIGSVNASAFQDGVIFNSNSSAYGAANSVDLSLGTPNNFNSFMPQNFWIGNGDSVLFKCSAAINYLGWNFTTVTES